MRYYVLGWINSRLIRCLVELQANAAYYVPGSVKELPWVEPDERQLKMVKESTRELCLMCAAMDGDDETSPVFHAITPSESLALTLFRHKERMSAYAAKMRGLQTTISECIDSVYQLRTKDLAIEILGFEPDEETIIHVSSLQMIAASLVMYAVGVAVGRWDVRKCKAATFLFDPFSPIPVCPPQMLQGSDGLPLAKAPEGYPLRFDSVGVLVDDAEHNDDIVRRVRDVIEVIWNNRADAIEREACEILGVKELRDYIRKSSNGGFWDDHVSRYSKSRRKAPIYWLLQSSKKNYGLWLYYHRFDKDLLFKALVNYVEPKNRLEASRLEAFRRQKAALGDSGKEAKRLASEIERQEDFLSELQDFEGKLRRAASLHLVPDLNDGVVLNIAPLHEHVPWKQSKNYWDELLKGEYEWSSIGQQLRQKGLVK